MGVNKRIIDAIPEIGFQLSHNEIIDASAFLGFDACIDHDVDNLIDFLKQKLSIGYY